MGRPDLERLSKEELIELVLRLQRPGKTPRTSSAPPSQDRKERRETSRPGGARPGHEGKARSMSDRFDRLVDHRPGQCSCCQSALPKNLVASVVSVHERIDLPEIRPVVERHRRLQVHCPACGALTLAPVPEAGQGTPFGSRLHAVATYLKTFQAFLRERLGFQKAVCTVLVLFGIAGIALS